MIKVSGITFQYVMKALESKTGISSALMLEHAGLKSEELIKHNAVIDSSKLSEIFRYCMEKTGNSNLALDIGQSITYQSLGILGYLLLNTNTLKQMIEKFSRYQKLVSDRIKFNFSEDETYYKFSVYVHENKNIHVPSFHAEVHLSAILNILTQILGQQVIPACTFFTQKKAEDCGRYYNLFGRNIFFEKDENAILFRKDALNIPVNNANESLLQYFEAQADGILQDMEKNSWFTGVEREILKNIGHSEITIVFVASKLNVSVRTLQNYLKAENKNFREALASVRKNLSQYYIRNTRLDDTSISSLLGYSEVSAFYRAFRKWNKSTPAEMRRRFSASAGIGQPI